MRRLAATLLLLASGLACAAVTTAVSVTDDSGTVIRLKAPATRIISVAPHTTELLFAAGAGKAVVGVSAYSDFPAAAKQIATVGSSAQLDLERIISLHPDLVVAWKSGNVARQIARLRQLGIPVFESEPRDFDTIATGIERLAKLAGSSEQGKTAATAFRQQLAALSQRYAARTPVRVFYQIWPSPLMTLNHAHLVSQALKLCGAENVFGKLPQLVPTVSMEAVIAADPEVIFISEDSAKADTMWQRFAQLQAVKQKNIFSVNGTLMNRAGPRILDGSEQLCEQVELARQRRKN
jgi:iron complex transport system substrate-binding protein